MEMDFKQLAVAIQSIAEEKNLPEATVKEVVEQALAAAYRRDYGEREQEVRVEMNLNTGEVDAYVSKEVVEKIGDENYEISVEDAQKLKKDAQIGDFVEIHEEVHACSGCVKLNARSCWLNLKTKSVRLSTLQ